MCVSVNQQNLDFCCGVFGGDERLIDLKIPLNFFFNRYLEDLIIFFHIYDYSYILDFKPMEIINLQCYFIRSYIW